MLHDFLFYFLQVADVVCFLGASFFISRAVMTAIPDTTIAPFMIGWTVGSLLWARLMIRSSERRLP